MPSVANVMDQKTNVPGLFRSESGALINKDNAALTAYKKRRSTMKMIPTMEKQLQLLENKILEMEKRIQKLEAKQ